MMKLIKSLFSKSAPADTPEDRLWNVMESMDSRNSLARLRQLNLNPVQFTLAKGLLSGSLLPADQPGVAEWCQTQEVSSTGVDAMTFALQMTLESAGTSYVFSAGEQFPIAMFPKLISSGDMTIAVSHVGDTPVIVTSLAELLSEHGITEHRTEILTPLEMRRRVKRKPVFSRDRVDRAVHPSVTIEKPADDQQQLIEPFELTDLVDAINQELGYNLSADQVTLEKGTVDELGLYSCIAQVDSITKQKIKFWVVPKAS